jgi:hypothetical protein
MRPLASKVSMLVVCALAVPLGASCMASDASEGAGDDTTVEGVVSSALEAQPHMAPPAPAPPPGTPMFSCAGFWNGLYCGGNLGFPGSPHALYYCFNNSARLVMVCPGVCVAGPPGVEDRC